MKKLLILSAFLLLPEPWVPIAIQYHRVTVEIEEGVATTHIDQVFRNESGQDVSSGVYLVRLIGDRGVVQTKKMVLLR
jgi:hypothetical protein